MKQRCFVTAAFAVCLASIAASASAQTPDAGHIDSGSTAWMLLCTSLVFLMTPGLGLFYAGMVRSKNVLSVLMQSFMAAGLVSVLWILVGYSLAFGPDHFGFVGDFSWWGMNHVSMYTSNSYAPTIPHMLFMIYQMMFAIITPAVISGAIVERMKFSSYCVFIGLWSLLVYAPLAHMAWGHNGLMQRMGLLDFAGGTVVEIASGVSALVLAMVVGRRRGRSEEMRPHNLPLTLIGTGILWFGWFGFNAGGSGASTPLAVSSFVATHAAAAAAATMWLILEWIVYKKPSALGFASGAVAGLVAITPAAGFVRPLPALFIGAMAAGVCFGAIKLKTRFGYDDALDVFGVHACGGIWGTLATGLFATVFVNGLAANGLFYGNAGQLWIQTKCVVLTIIFTAIGTLVVAKLAGLLTGGLRASEDDEENGLDVTEHGEVGYHGDGSGMPVLSGID